MATFDREPIFRRLKALCPVRFIIIDDLITTGVYGVTLTLAYARGIRDSGPLQTSTHFVFMNSDFVLADGSLRTLVGKLREGHRCVMAPSLRACSEAVLPVLLAAAEKAGGTLAMAPRDMVKLAFDNLHPTVIGKTITQEFVTCATHNQIYWQVDKNTLLGRYHLMFMLAIRPEVPMQGVNSYCDYGFVPELVPSDRITVLDDSDQFFMLELQAEAQENFMLRCGTSSPRQIANGLSRWTTREHRRFAEKDIVIHADDLPAALADIRAEAAAFMAAVRRNMRRRPWTHIAHFYWVSGVQAWAVRKYGEDGSPHEFPPELAHQKSRIYVALLGRVRRLAGALPNVPIWNYLWLDSRLVLNWVAAARSHPPSRKLLICDAASPLPRALSTLVPLDVWIDRPLSAVGEAAQRQRAANAEQLYDNILIHVYRANVRSTREKLNAAMRLARPDGTISIYIEHRHGELDGSNFSLELAQYVNEVLAFNWIGSRVVARFVGGRVRRKLRRIEIRMVQYLMPSSVLQAPLTLAAVLLWPVVAALTAANNWRLRSPSKSCPEYCSSALLSVTRLQPEREAFPGPGMTGAAPVGDQLRVALVDH